jgi:hypothetical protein
MTPGNLTAQFGSKPTNKRKMTIEETHFDAIVIGCEISGGGLLKNLAKKA